MDLLPGIKHQPDARNLLRPLARQYDSHSRDTLSPAVRKYFACDFKADSLGLHKENIFVQEFTSKQGQCTSLSPSRTHARSLKQATDGSESKTRRISKGGSVAVSSLEPVLMTGKALFKNAKQKGKKTNPLSGGTVLIHYVTKDHLTAAQTRANG